MEPKVVLEADEFDRIVELRGTCLNDQAERNTLLVYWLSWSISFRSVATELQSEAPTEPVHELFYGSR
jgi:hypothetical protein